MSFFGLFKSKQEREFDSLIESFEADLFPSGEKGIHRDCERIDILTNGKIHPSNLQGFVRGCKSIVFTSDSYDDDDFVKSNVARSKGCISKEEALDVYAYLAGEALYYDNFSRAFGNSESSGNLNDLYGDTPWIFSEGVSTNRIPGGYGDYGLSVTNPIPTISVACSNRYISKLRYNGNEVVANRLGSTKSDITPGNIDIYNLEVLGLEVGTIYICPYHKRNSNLAPRAFALTVV